jgi:hypothetical protein
VIGCKLGVLVEPALPEHFDLLGRFYALDTPASSELTQARFGSAALVVGPKLSAEPLVPLPRRPGSPWMSRCRCTKLSAPPWSATSSVYLGRLTAQFAGQRKAARSWSQNRRAGSIPWSASADR